MGAKKYWSSGLLNWGQEYCALNKKRKEEIDHAPLVRQQWVGQPWDTEGKKMMICVEWRWNGAGYCVQRWSVNIDPPLQTQKPGRHGEQPRDICFTNWRAGCNSTPVGVCGKNHQFGLPWSQKRLYCVFSAINTRQASLPGKQTLSQLFVDPPREIWLLQTFTVFLKLSCVWMMSLILYVCEESHNEIPNDLIFMAAVCAWQQGLGICGDHVIEKL